MTKGLCHGGGKCHGHGSLTLGSYTDLCGTLFRFPGGELSDYYWDDYEESISAKSWLRKKYTAPFRRGAVGDTYMGNRFYVQDFRDRCPEFGDDTPLIDVLRKVIFEEDFNSMIEHRTVGGAVPARSVRQNGSGRMAGSDNEKNEKTGPENRRIRGGCR